MKWIGIVAVQLVVFAPIGYAVYSVAHVNQPVVPSWATNQTETAAKPAPPARSRSPTSPQRAIAGDIPCDAQIWPNVAPSCVTGPGEPVILAQRASTAHAPPLARPAR